MLCLLFAFDYPFTKSGTEWLVVKIRKNSLDTTLCVSRVDGVNNNSAPFDD